MNKKILIVLLILICIASPLFAEDTSSGLDAYIKNFRDAAVVIAILISSIFIIFAGFKIWSAGGLNKDNVGYLVGIIAGIIIIALAAALPEWVQKLNSTF